MSVITKLKRGRAEDVTRSDAAAEDPSALSAMDRAVRRRRVTPVRIAIGITLLLFLAAGVFGYMRYGTQRTLSVSVERVTISAAQQAAFREFR